MSLIGHGRTGIIAAILIGLLSDKSLSSVLNLTQILHDTRKTRLQVNSPQTQAQTLQVVQILRSVQATKVKHELRALQEKLQHRVRAGIKRPKHMQQLSVFDLCVRPVDFNGTGMRLKKLGLRNKITVESHQRGLSLSGTSRRARQSPVHPLGSAEKSVSGGSPPFSNVGFRLPARPVNHQSQGRKASPRVRCQALVRKL